jgi:DNA-binding NarL/FixJ family response regulator
MSYGAFGYLLKDSSHDVIYEGIKSAYKGNMVVNPQVAKEIFSTNNGMKKLDIEKFNLSHKEIKIIEGIANGLTNKEISDKLFLSEGTIKNNITNILSKLKLRDRTQIAIFAFKNRIVT